MATIKAGYDNKPTHITVSTGEHDGKAAVWIEQFGLPRILGKHGVVRMGTLTGLKDGENYQPSTETLGYAEIGELIALRNEINEAIKELAGV